VPLPYQLVHRQVVTAEMSKQTGLENRALFRAIAEQVHAKLEEFEAQGLANTAWAFAVMAVADPLLVNAIASCAVDAVEEFTGQALANLAWAFAHMLLRNKPFFAVL